jgi:hypothetical protein
MGLHDSHLLEVKSGVLHTFDGETHEVQGGAYLTPEGFLATSAELDRLRAHYAESQSNRGVVLVLGAALLGLAAGYWLGRRRDD